MANYCFTNYVVEGKRDVLDRIKNVINAKSDRDKSDSTNDMGDILVELGIYATEKALIDATQDYAEDTPEGLGVYGNWMDAKLEEIVGQTTVMPMNLLCHRSSTPQYSE